MLKQLFIGSITMGLIILIHAEMLALYYQHSKYLRSFTKHLKGRLKNSTMIVISVFWVLFAITIEVWLWAIVLLLLSAVTGLEPAVYFAIVCFTTLGFGDMILTEEWRILSAMIATSGMLIFGWSTAFLFDVMQTIHNGKR
ncbi:MAG: ion channel [Methyloligellaceae bacterium]